MLKQPDRRVRFLTEAEAATLLNELPPHLKAMAWQASGLLLHLRWPAGGQGQRFGVALQRAGIRDFRWHDLRHTWASWHIQGGGTPLFALQELGGWATADMVRRYAHLTPGHLSTHVDRFAGQVGSKVAISSYEIATLQNGGANETCVAA